ncbi:MAG: T9SS type A sorting domain-containing protein, partial [Bacteroidota bacterium]
AQGWRAGLAQPRPFCPVTFAGLWSGILTNPLTANGLSHVHLFHNDIILDLNSWKNWTFFSGGGGVTCFRERERKIDSLFFFHNRVEFRGPLLNDPDNAHYSAGFIIGNNESPVFSPMSDWDLTHNEFIAPTTSALYVENSLRRSLFANNHIIDPGSGLEPIWSGFRSAVFVNDSTELFQISHNQFLSQSGNNLISQQVYANGWQGSPHAFFNNYSEYPLTPSIVYGSDHLGNRWDSVGLRPSLAWEVDSLEVQGTDTTWMEVVLDQTLDSAADYALYPIDPFQEYGQDWWLPQEVGMVPPDSLRIRNPLIHQLEDSSQERWVCLQLMVQDAYQLGEKHLLAIHLAPHMDSLSTSANSPLPPVMEIFPNPAGNHCHLNGQVGHTYDISLQTLSGQVLLQRRFDTHTSLDLGQFPPGCYLLIGWDRLTNQRFHQKILHVF